jgi:prophage regulatory protein
VLIKSFAVADKIIRIHEVSERTGLSASTVRRLVRNGIMPAPVQLAERAIGWRASSIDQWIADRPNTSQGAGHGA